MRRQLGFVLPLLDAETADLGLEVVAAQVFDAAVRQPALQVAGLVQPGVRPGAERVGNEAFRRQLEPVQVAAPCLDTGNVQPSRPSIGTGCNLPSSIDMPALVNGLPMVTLMASCSPDKREAVQETVASVGPSVLISPVDSGRMLSQAFTFCAERASAVTLTRRTPCR